MSTGSSLIIELLRDRMVPTTGTTEEASYSYNQSGRIQTITRPDAGQLQYGWNESNLLVSYTAPGEGTVTVNCIIT